MIIKDKFTLLKGTPNVLKLSSGVMKVQAVPGDRANVVRIIRLIERRVRNHYTSNQVFELTSGLREIRKRIHVVNLKDYPLSVSYNKPTKRIVINLSPFGVDEISKVDEMNVYAALVYGLCFESFVTGKKSMKVIYYGPISNWLTTVFVKVFGKEYGLLGPYTAEITKLKFLIACYVLGAFFGVTGTTAYRKAATVSSVDYKAIKDRLSTYNFTKVEDFIKSLSDFKVLPGYEIRKFTAKFYRFLGINFLPALEDVSRFVSVIATSDVTSSSIIPTFIGKTYNRSEYEKILEISKSVFK